MKIAHVADSHLGYRSAGIQQLVPDPWRPGVMLRQRQVDLLCGFDRVVTGALEAGVHLAIHAGDLFDSARPSAQAVSFAMTQLQRLTDAGIQVILIEGNHSFPRDRSLGHAHEILAHMVGVHAVFDKPALLRFGPVSVFAYPHAATSKGRWPGPAEFDSDRYNLVMAHGTADGHPFFAGDRPAANLDVAAIADVVDLVLLGHYHRFAQVPATDNAFYAGPAAMVSWADFRPGHTFSFNVIDTELSELRVVDVETRPMIAFGLDDAQGLSRQEVLNHLSNQALERDCTGANCQTVLHNLDPLVRREISVRDVEELFESASALQITLHTREQRWEDVRRGLSSGGGLTDRFRGLLAQTDGDDAFKEAVEAQGVELLEIATEKLEEEDMGEEAQ